MDRHAHSQIGNATSAGRPRTSIQAIGRSIMRCAFKRFMCGRLIRLLPLAILTVGILQPAYAQNEGAITIVNSGSSSASGYEINVSPDGTMIYKSNDIVRTAKLSPPQAKQLYATVKMFQPFSGLTPNPCMNPASDPKVVVTYDSKASPNINCGGNPKAIAFYSGITFIEQFSGIKELLPKPQTKIKN